MKGTLNRTSWILLLAGVSIIMTFVALAIITKQSQDKEEKSSIEAEKAEEDLSELSSRFGIMCKRKTPEGKQFRELLRAQGYSCGDIEDAVTEGSPNDGLTPTERLDVSDVVESIIKANPSLTTSAVVSEVIKYFENNPPKRGERGKDGEAPGRELISAIIEEVYSANPPEPGVDGIDGIDGTSGTSGTDGPQGPPPACSTMEGGCKGTTGQSVTSIKCIEGTLMYRVGPETNEYKEVQGANHELICGQAPQPTEEPTPGG